MTEVAAPKRKPARSRRVVEDPTATASATSVAEAPARPKAPRRRKSEAAESQTELPPPPPELPTVSAEVAAARAREILAAVLASLDDDKTQEIVTIDLDGRSSIADAIVIGTATSSRHVAAIVQNLAVRLKEKRLPVLSIEGTRQGDWAVLDASDVIVHVFRAEVRNFYALEKMWGVDMPRTADAVVPSELTAIAARRRSTASRAASTAKVATEALSVAKPAVRRTRKPAAAEGSEPESGADAAAASGDGAKAPPRPRRRKAGEPEA